MYATRSPLVPQYTPFASQQSRQLRRLDDKQQSDRAGDAARNYERNRATTELAYQRGQTQGTNQFDANQRALTGGDSTGALWGAAMTPVSPQPSASPGFTQDVAQSGGQIYNTGFLNADQAYNSETKRQALSGLTGAFQGLAGGAGGGAPGLNISGPNGPIASVNYQTSINPQQQVFDPQQGMAQMQAAPPQAAGQGGQAFANNYAGLGQANAVNFDRAGTAAQGQYQANATQAQQQGALAGLGQQNRAAANAGNRASRAFGMGTNMMSGLLR
jgi:hypothetical protein